MNSLLLGKIIFQKIEINFLGGFGDYIIFSKGNFDIEFHLKNDWRYRGETLFYENDVGIMCFYELFSYSELNKNFRRILS